jgi:purine-nucleoside phosphorylase
METAALYANAIYAGKKALGLFTISDHLYKGEKLSAEERQTGFNNMIKVALDIHA